MPETIPALAEVFAGMSDWRKSPGKRYTIGTVYPFSGLRGAGLNGRGWTAREMARIGQRDRQGQRNEQRPIRVGAADGKFRRQSAFAGQTGCLPRTACHARCAAR